MEIKITLDLSPQFLSVLQPIADALKNVQPPTAKEATVVNMTGSKKRVDKADPPKETVDEQSRVTAPVEKESETKVVTLEQVRQVVNKKLDEKKRDQVKKLLADFGVPNLSSLQKDSYADFIVKAEAI